MIDNRQQKSTVSIETDEKLKAARDRIDTIDEDILRLINSRLDAAQVIAQVKTSQEEPAFYRPEREAQVLSRLKNLNSGPLENSGLESLFREIISITRGTEAGLSVAVPGPPGTYAEVAARQHFGSTIDIVDFPIMDEIFKATENAHTNFSVVPIENSIEGGVVDTLDRLITTPLSICGEINLKINHNLMSHESNLAAIKRIYAHTQSISQCKRWIDIQCPTANCIPVSSNADAARRASVENEAAAIAGKTAAKHYDLNILAANIEGGPPGNTTRFLILSNRAAPESGHDKTSLLLSCRNRPGALIHLLQPLLDEQIDMTKIESWSSRVSTWDCIFFIDIVGHQDEEQIGRALNRLKVEAGFYKNLGSYPATA